MNNLQDLLEVLTANGNVDWNENDANLEFQTLASQLTVIISKQKNSDRYVNAGNLLSVDESDGLTLDEMILAIEKQAKLDGTLMVDWIDGVYTSEILENRLSCDEFLETI